MQRSPGGVAAVARPARGTTHGASSTPRARRAIAPALAAAVVAARACSLRRGSPRAAQGAVRSVHGDWQIRCDTPPGAQGEQCALMQSVTAEDRANVGLTVIVLKTADQKSRLMRVVAPLGVLLPSGLGLKIDNDDVGRAGFVRCLPNGCVAEVVMDDNLINQMRTGQTATFIIFQTPEEGIGFPMSLEGLRRRLRQAALTAQPKRRLSIGRSPLSLGIASSSSDRRTQGYQHGYQSRHQAIPGHPHRRGMAQAFDARAVSTSCAGTAPSAPGSCALNYEKRAGTFSCAGCGQPLFASKKKFESGTGWPSFNDPVPGAVETTEDRSYGMVAHRGALQPLRQPSRPRLRRRPAADAPALLHQRRGA